MNNKIHTTNALTRITATMLASLLSSTGLASDLAGLDCLIHPNMTVELSSPVSGVIESIAVDRSDQVMQGNVLARLTSDVEQQRYRVAHAKAHFEGTRESAKVNLELNRKEYERAKALYKDSTIPLADKDRARANLEIARHDYETALHQSKVLKLELEEALANLELRTIRSPIDGVVVDRYMTPGEFVDSRPVLKVAQLHPLRVEMITPVEHFDSIRTGMHARIYPEFGEYGDLVAEVTVVDKVIDAASGTFGVRLALNNEEYRVPGGLKCKLSFFTEEEELAWQEMTAEASTPADDAMVSLQQQKPADTVPEFIAPEFIAPEIVAPTASQQCASLTGWQDKNALQLFMDAGADFFDASEIIEHEGEPKYWLVISEAYDGYASSKQAIKDLKAASHNDVASLRYRGDRVISAGLFASRDNADRRAAAMQASGLRFSVQPYNTRRSYEARVLLSPGTDIQSVAAMLDDNQVATEQECGADFIDQRLVGTDVTLAVGAR